MSFSTTNDSFNVIMEARRSMFKSVDETTDVDDDNNNNSLDESKKNESDVLDNTIDKD